MTLMIQLAIIIQYGWELGRVDVDRRCFDA
ncbi:Uncharacterised protein [Budvicia aquatica]|uniref:Uncharacterized protein n=1 Tax=Budvicia aquatica TaxID=82979 RepID=A0A484ZLI4_9GAMM|nr:Uncharacterised protein [Budvicia aquatica]